ncbi:hypothetical protein D9615_007019 [Tricholomella constricta]|uniref:Uncharacterized protein n=1 Tax=Tricholomella constricta TaxID=117010 RepID=A0A8H5M2U4_9AGAR|nr:hypothetical protein D9615_007019 [Tricholomella constricta]
MFRLVVSIPTQFSINSNLLQMGSRLHRVLKKSPPLTGRPSHINFKSQGRLDSQSIALMKHRTWDSGLAHGVFDLFRSPDYDHAPLGYTEMGSGTRTLKPYDTRGRDEKGELDVPTVVPHKQDTTGTHGARGPVRAPRYLESGTCGGRES